MSLNSDGVKNFTVLLVPGPCVCMTYRLQCGVYVSLKAGPNRHSLSISGLPSRDTVHIMPYNHDIRLLLPLAPLPFPLLTRPSSLR
jgi:hypothetical protein